MSNLSRILLIVVAFAGVSAGANAATSVGSAFGQCKVEVKQQLGADTRVKLKGSRQKAGALVVKLSVLPKGESRQTLFCTVKGETAVLTNGAG